MDQDKAVLCFEQALSVLPAVLRRAAGQLSETEKKAAEEIRLRAGRTMTVLLPDREIDTGAVVEQEDLESVCNLATEFSRYAAAETIRMGYLPMRGGCRIGLCGTAVIKNGCNTNLKEISAASIRIARERSGIANELTPQLLRDGTFISTLILAPPGAGKTTLLRDLVRCLSDGIEIEHPFRVSLVDERSEVAVLWRGQPQMNVGSRTDVLEACPKALAIPMMLRAMNPQIIAVDEITAREDLTAMTQAANCGVGLLATIHGGSISELLQKPLYADLLSAKVFSLAILIERAPEGRHFRVEELPC
jgi:stage III sporulation protein AA